MYISMFDNSLLDACKGITFCTLQQDKDKEGKEEAKEKDPLTSTLTPSWSIYEQYFRKNEKAIPQYTSTEII